MFKWKPSDKWYKEMAKLEEGHDISAGVPWKPTGEQCPECGSQLIENRKRVECSELRCDYIKHVKVNE